MGATSSRTALSANNSTGASIAAYELSNALSQPFSEINLNGNVSQQFKELFQRLDQEASKYSNSQVEDEKSAEWNPHKFEVKLVAAAWECAHRTYKARSNTAPAARTADAIVFDKEDVFQESFVGTVKPITSTIIEQATDTGETNDLLPVLVIAHGTEGLSAHSGFLNSALALDSAVAQMIFNYVLGFDAASKQKPHVLFTGHSAGGAVSQLLYLHHISHPDFNQSVRFSCVTFGAPPCLTSPINLSLYHPSERTLCVNLINEFDVVTRADKPYILSLVDIARAMLNLPPKSAVPEPATNERIVDAALEATKDEESKLSHKLKELNITAPKTWHLPQPLYHHVGPRVVLLMRLVESEMNLKAVEVTPSEFQKLLFCRVAVHSRKRYEERITALNKGTFNGRKGWGPDGDSKEKASH
ncbi:hypothetical protein FGRMN_4071 [Fusarium graminum]|nr:hypothetical protein FGRMN_4071 [Fusarium graminum]